MLLVGYCFGIRSERWLCKDVHLNLADSVEKQPVAGSESGTKSAR